MRDSVDRVLRRRAALVAAVMPAGGAGEWMTNWQQPPTGSTTAPQWDTFVGEELPAYLNENFDIGTTDNALSLIHI